MNYIFKTKLTFLFLIFANGLNGLSLAQESLTTILSENDVTLPYVSPWPAMVKGVDDPILSANGEWRVSIEGSQPVPVEVPGELIMQNINLNVGETAVYKKEVQLPEDWQGKRVFLRFDAVSSHALIKVNGLKVGEHEGSFVPFQMEITKALKNGDNSIEVAVRANTISDVLGCTSQYAVHTVAGILRKATLFAAPDTFVHDITINTLFDDHYKNAELGIFTRISGAGKESGHTLNYILQNVSGKKVASKSAAVSGISKEGIATVKVSIPVKNVEHWNPEQPYLYTLVTQLLLNGKLLQENREQVGFKEIEVEGGRVFVNGKPIRLHGVNRHITHPLSGRSLPPELERLDAKLFKEANNNYIRTSHYPPSEEFLRAADSIGLFVESEASLTWIEHHASPIWGHWNYKNSKYLPYFLQANLDNIQAYKNHPSILIWSLANESRWSPLWKTVKKVVSELDPTRPNSFHDQCWGGFNNAGSTADIANYHYPGINGPAATDTMQRPVLFGEYSHLSTYNRRELLTDPGVREAYNQPLVTFYDSIYSHPKNLGGAIWSGIDDTFHLPNGKIVGYGPWGPLDGWRRTKPEYFGMKKAYSPIKILDVTPSKGKITVSLENRYDFTDLSKIKMKVFVNGNSIPVKLKLAPHSRGDFSIPAKEKPESLHLVFYDPSGFVTEEFVHDFMPRLPFTTNKKTEVTYTENEESYLVRQGNITYRIAKNSGKVVSIAKNGEQVFIEGPSFAISPRNTEDGGKNNIAGETYQRVIHPIQTFPWYYKFPTDLSLTQIDGGIVIKVTITFKEGKGALAYMFAADGTFSTEYEIETNDDINPYQYGLLMQVPKNFEQLEWERQGDFSIYPDDHIGRNKGKATLSAQETIGAAPWRKEPEHPWKDDANELGSNDFRSTKHNIWHTSLTNGEGTELTVISDTTQASRTWLQENNIHWLIADYWNNGSEPFYGTPHSDGRIKTKGKILEGKLILLIE